MVIQRIQSIYLLCAAIMMALLCFVFPVAEVPGSEQTAALTMYISDFVPLLIINLLVVVLLVIDIFLYRKLPLQIKVARICVVLIVVSALLEAFMLYSYAQLGDAVTIKWYGSASMLAVSLVLSALALNAMSRDHKLLTSYDRLR